MSSTRHAPAPSNISQVDLYILTDFVGFRYGIKTLSNLAHTDSKLAKKKTAEQATLIGICIFTRRLAWPYVEEAAKFIRNRKWSMLTPRSHSAEERRGRQQEGLRRKQRYSRDRKQRKEPRLQTKLGPEYKYPLRIINATSSGKGRARDRVISNRVVQLVHLRRSCSGRSQLRVGTRLRIGNRRKSSFNHGDVLFSLRVS